MHNNDGRQATIGHESNGRAWAALAVEYGELTRQGAANDTDAKDDDADDSDENDDINRVVDM